VTPSDQQTMPRPNLRRLATAASEPPVSWNVAALERSDNVADNGHAFAMLKRGYTNGAVLMHETEIRPPPGRRNIRH
jgi:hypothetical protein